MSKHQSDKRNMTDQEFKKLTKQIAVMQSYLSGKLLEELFIELDELTCWVPSIEPEWDWSSFNYRIATVQDGYTPSEFIHNSNEKEILMVEDIKTDGLKRIKKIKDKPINPNRPGLQIKNKVKEKQIKSPKVNQNQSEALESKLKAIDDEYAALQKRTVWQNIALIFKRGY